MPVSNPLVYAYLYENLQQIYIFNERTRLCVYPPSGKLFVVKSVDLSCKAGYDALRSLDNPCLARIFYTAEKDGRLEVVREYISGDTLAELIQGGRALPPDRAARITADLCDGLSDMHRLGYVHRDINPNNVIISPDGHATIIDFGIARSFEQRKNSDTTILGTPGYAAPEQFGFTQSDSRTDVYAVGTLLNVMLTGRLPNEQKAPGALGKIVGKATEIDSRKRYTSLYDLKKALDKVVPCDDRSERGKIRGKSLLDRVIKQLPGLRSHNTLVVILAALGYVFAALFSFSFFYKTPPEEIFVTIVTWILILPVPFFCFHNFLGIWDKLPFSSKATRRNQKIVYTILGILSIFVGVTLYGIAFPA